MISDENEFPVGQVFDVSGRCYRCDRTWERCRCSCDICGGRWAECFCNAEDTNPNPTSDEEYILSLLFVNYLSGKIKRLPRIPIVDFSRKSFCKDCDEYLYLISDAHKDRFYPAFFVCKWCNKVFSLGRHE